MVPLGFQYYFRIRIFDYSPRLNIKLKVCMCYLHTCTFVTFLLTIQLCMCVCVCLQKRCCGVDGPWDYVTSEWYNEMNPVDVRC